MSVDSKDALWLQGTRRNTRSSSNHEKEAKEKVGCIFLFEQYNIVVLVPVCFLKQSSFSECLGAF